ncbi:MAG: nucleoside-diphosphate sugar epimerase [Burkholderiales bacterium PBB3]|nr:MAG: nucleoside-diphosphate sugar epimerase [Burkholderiales bacterium PBB3]
MADHARVAMVAGATGLVGREILAALLADKSYTAVHSVGRRKIDLQHPKLVQHVVDFAKLKNLPPVDDVLIALGTTIKVAGSQAAFRAVDFEAVVALARTARAQGASNLGVVSAMGASAHSPIFYNRVKGDMEAAVSALGYASVSIAQPSMLAGDRAALDQPTRSGEGLALSVSRWLKPLIPANYRSVRAADVAAGLLRAVRASKPGVHRVLSGALQGAATARS